MENNRDFDGFVTKYTLTAGIQAMRLRPPGEGGGNAYEVLPNGKENLWTYYAKEGRDWHRTFESALADAQLRKKTKLASLRKQIAKIEAMSFEKVPAHDR